MNFPPIINRLVKGERICTQMNIEKVGPTHCTGKEQEALFAKAYKDNCIPIKVGQTIEI